MKGFFSFLIILAIMLILFNFSNMKINNSNDFLKTKNNLIENEFYSKERTILENNFDKIIKVKINEFLLKGKTNVVETRNELNEELIKYLKKRAFATDLFFENEKTLTLDYLNSNSILIIFKTEKLSYIEYVFTSNETKTNNISKMFKKNSELLFKIPINYSQKVID